MNSPPFDISSVEYQQKRLQEIQTILAEREMKHKEQSQEERVQAEEIRRQNILNIISKKNGFKST